MKRTIPKQKQRKRAHKIERVVRSIVSCCEVFRTHGGGATRLVRLLPPSTPSCSSDVIVAQRPPRWSFPCCSLVWSCSRQFGAMVLTCAVESCRTNYKEQANKVVVIPEKQSVFKFPNPVKRAELRLKSIRFCNRKDFVPTENSVICSKHFDPKLIKFGDRNTLHVRYVTLRWKLNPLHN